MTFQVIPLLAVGAIRTTWHLNVDGRATELRCGPFMTRSGERWAVVKLTDGTRRVVAVPDTAFKRVSRSEGLYDTEIYNTSACGLPTFSFFMNFQAFSKPYRAPIAHVYGAWEVHGATPWMVKKQDLAEAWTVAVGPYELPSGVTWAVIRHLDGRRKIVTGKIV